MSKLAYSDNAGQMAIITNKEELLQLNQVELGRAAIDEVIPLPDLSIQEQKARLSDCTHEDHGEQYWESEDGDYGWCCTYCGTVKQWG